jgi:hypothetical protein
MPQEQAFMNRPKDYTVELTSGSTFPATFGATGNASTNPRYPTWVQVIGAGTNVIKWEDGSSSTLICTGGEVIPGTILQVTSMGSTQLRLGVGKVPPPINSLATAAGTSIADAGNFTAQTTVEAALQEIYQDLKTTHLLVPVRLFGGILAAGTPLAAWADNAGASAPGVTLADSKAVGVRWNNQATQTAVWAPPIEIPYEADVSANATLFILCSKTGATSGDATTFTVTAFAQTVGQLHDADTDFGGTSSAINGAATAKTVQQSTLTLALADLAALAAPASLSMSIKPTNGTLGTDDMIVESAFIAFKRKLRTS